MTDVSFDTGVLPPLGVAGLDQTFKLDEMQPGQSFFHECDKAFAAKLASAVRTYAKASDKKFATKRLDTGAKYGSREVTTHGLAVWRL